MSTKEQNQDERPESPKSPSPEINVAPSSIKVRSGSLSSSKVDFTNRKIPPLEETPKPLIPPKTVISQNSVKAENAPSQPSKSIELTSHNADNNDHQNELPQTSNRAALSRNFSHEAHSESAAKKGYIPLISNSSPYAVVNRSQSEDSMNSTSFKLSNISSLSQQASAFFKDAQSFRQIWEDLDDESDKSEANFAPVPSVSVTFENIFMEIRKKESVVRKIGGKVCRKNAKVTGKKILELGGINFTILPGDLVAILGQSGAGKSVFLNVLSGRVKKGVTGNVLLNNQKATDAMWKACSCYVQQEDIFFPKLTVHEHLKYQALLRLPRTIKEHERERIVSSLLNRFNLDRCKDHFIGSTTGGSTISGGERKRLALCTELLMQPSVVFADEPTTGLDSYMASEVVATLKALADAGRTILCTIHQPSTQLFEMFSKVIILSEGRLMYHGDREGSICWFHHLGIECPTLTNPAEFLIKTVAVDYYDRENSIERINDMADQWKNQHQQFFEFWKTKGNTLFREQSSIFEKEMVNIATSDAKGVVEKMRSLFEDSNLQLKEGDEFEDKMNEDKNGGRDDNSNDIDVDGKPNKKSNSIANNESNRDTADNTSNEKKSFDNNQNRGDTENVQTINTNLDDKKKNSTGMVKHDSMDKSDNDGKTDHMKSEDKNVGVKIEDDFQIYFAGRRISRFARMSAVCKRSFLLAVRTPEQTYLRFVIALCTSIFTSLFYFRLEWTLKDSWNKVSACFFVILSQSISTLFSTAFIFAKNRIIVEREYEAGVVDMYSYFFGIVCIDVIVWTIFPFIYHTIAFWVMGLDNEAWKWIASYCILWLAVQCMNSYAYLVASLISNKIAVIACTQIMQIVFQLFSGFMLRLSELPRFWIWLVYLSPYRYGLTNYTYIIFEGETIPQPNGSITGREFLTATFGFDGKTEFWRNVGALCALTIAIRFISAFILEMFARRKKQNEA